MSLKTPEDLRRVALKWLARRDHSRHELEQKFYARNIDPDLIEFAMTGLIHEGWVNDERMTENYIHSRQQKGYGPKRIAQELQVKGVSIEIINTYLNPNDPTWREIARKLWEKHFGDNSQTQQKPLKQVGFLYSRGFDREIIQELTRCEFLDYAD